LTNWSFDHVAETRAALRTIVDDPAYGATALSNVRVMSEVLAGLLPGARFERSVLVTAAEQSTARALLERVSDGMDPGHAVRLSAQSLVTISSVPIAACYRVAAELALALGLISVEEADALASGEDDTGSGSGADSAYEDAESEPAPPTQPQTVVLPRPAPPDLGKTTAQSYPATAPADGPAAPGPGTDNVEDDWFSWGEPETGAKPSAQPPAPPSAEPGPRPAFVPSQGYASPPDQQAAYGPPTAAPVTPAPYEQQSPLLDFHRQSAPLSEEWISELVRDTVHPGLLAFNPPLEMHQGRSERIEVGVARSPELRDALTAGFRGRGLPEVVHVDAAPLMGVELRGSAFSIEALSTVEQLVVPLARWEFDVTPLKSGSQTLTLCVTIRIESPDFSGGRIAVPVFERDIRIKVDVVYGTRRFVASNWQWLVGTAVGLGGGIAAWISLVH
jgi:hypothetical protein